MARDGLPENLNKTEMRTRARSLSSELSAWVLMMVCSLSLASTSINYLIITWVSISSASATPLAFILSSVAGARLTLILSLASVTI